jgi:Acyl-CoA dehydrogenase, C-terminal domain
MTDTTNSTFDADVLDMLRGSLRAVLTESSGRSLADRLADLGFDEVLAQDEATAMGLLFELRGETLSGADALGMAMSRYLAKFTGTPGDRSVTVALPSPFGPSTDGTRGLTVDAVVTGKLGDWVAVPVDGRLAIGPSAGLTTEPLPGYQEDLGYSRITGTVPAGTVRWIGGDAWSQLVDRGRWLLSCELTGIGRHVIAGAVDYTKNRVQYGKPIGVFQALQHRLAAAHTLVTGAAQVATEAGRDRSEWTALVAKCITGQAAENACTQAQQCYGAIGFTWEHEFHRYLRRTYALDRLLGDWRTLEHELGTRLQATGQVPRIGSL